MTSVASACVHSGTKPDRGMQHSSHVFEPDQILALGKHATKQLQAHRSDVPTDVGLWAMFGSCCNFRDGGAPYVEPMPGRVEAAPRYLAMIRRRVLTRVPERS